MSTSHYVIQVRDAVIARLTGLPCGVDCQPYTDRAVEIPDGKKGAMELEYIRHDKKLGGLNSGTDQNPLIAEDVDVLFNLHILVTKTGDFQKVAFDQICVDVENALFSSKDGLTLSGVTDWVGSTSGQATYSDEGDTPLFDLMTQLTVSFTHNQSQPTKTGA